MASNEQSVTRLRMNKRAQVEALRSLGFDLEETAKASEFPTMVKWSAGLLDLTVAANRKRDGKKFFFTKDEWQSLSATEQELFVLRGIRIRANGTSFVMAAEQINNKAWGGSIAVPDAHNHRTKRDNFAYWDALEETNIVIRTYEGKSANGVTGAPAAEAAVAYKAAYLERDDYADTSEWCLPTLAQLVIMFHYRDEINALITSIWDSSFNLQNVQYWSCQNWDTNSAYRLDFNIGSAWVDSKQGLKAVRPITLT